MLAYREREHMFTPRERDLNNIIAVNEWGVATATIFYLAIYYAISVNIEVLRLEKQSSIMGEVNGISNF